jgi:hypothetical protein
MRQRAAANELYHRCDRRRSGFAMIDDMPRLKQAMEQMDAEDPTVAQAAKDRAAQTLSDAKLNFSKMAELIEQRRLLLRPRIVAGIKRMDQPGMLGDAAFRDTGSALRKEGQSFRQIAEAIERTDRPARPALQYGDPVQTTEPMHQMASEPGTPAWLRALAFVASIVFFPLLHPIRFLAIALLAMLLFYALRGFVPSGRQALEYFDGVAAVRDSAGKALSSVSSFVNEHIFWRSKEATPTPAAPTPSPPAAAPSPPSATPSAAPATAPAPPATAPAPSSNAPAAPAPPSVAPAAPSAAPAGPPVSTPHRDARGTPPSKSAADCGAAREDRYPWSRCCAPFEDDHPRIEDDRPSIEDDRPRTFEDIIPEGIRRHSPMAGPCIGGVGGCSWGGSRY